MALPYRMAIKDDYGDTIFLDYNDVHIQNYFEAIVDGVVKPYLRPMSSMTDEEATEYANCGSIIAISHQNDYLIPNPKSIQYLLENHFDFMGLIPKGVAIEVTESNNPYKE